MPSNLKDILDQTEFGRKIKLLCQEFETAVNRLLELETRIVGVGASAKQVMVARTVVGEREPEGMLLHIVGNVNSGILGKINAAENLLAIDSSQFGNVPRKRIKTYILRVRQELVRARDYINGRLEEDRIPVDQIAAKKEEIFKKFDELLKLTYSDEREVWGTKT